MRHEINIYGDIVPFKMWNDGTEYDLQSLNEDLNAIDFKDSDELVVNIHTFGGCTTTAFTIYNKLLNLKARKNITITTHVDGYCASSGVIILLAGDKRIGNQYAEPFIHNAWTFSEGDANEHRKQAEDLERVNNQIANLYAERTKIDKDKAIELMNADGYITADDALNYGFYTELENVNIQSQNYIKQYFKRHKNQDKRQKTNNSKLNSRVNMENFTKEEKGVLQRFLNSLGFGNNEPKKNILVKTADQKELDFYEREEGDVQVGDKATLEGTEAQGEIVLADGRTLIFDAGVVVEIKEKEDNNDSEEVENLKKQLAEANAKLSEQNKVIENKETEMATLTNKITELETEHTALVNKLKGAFSNVKIDDPNPDPSGNGKTKKLTMAEMIANKKVKK